MSFRRKFAHATKVISWHGQSYVANEDARQALKYAKVISASLSGCHSLQNAAASVIPVMQLHS